MMLRCRNRHIQTILPVILPKPKYEYRREYIPMEDGGQVALDWGVTGTLRSFLYHHCVP